MRLIHEQHPHHRIEFVICIINGCSAGCNAGNHKVGTGNGHHDVELCVGDRGAKVSGISLLRRERELERKIDVHYSRWLVILYRVGLCGWSAKEIDSRQKWYINVSIEHLFPSCSASPITRCHQIPKTSFEIYGATCAETNQYWLCNYLMNW